MAYGDTKYRWQLPQGAFYIQKCGRPGCRTYRRFYGARFEYCTARSAWSIRRPPCSVNEETK